MHRIFTLVTERDGDWFVAACPEVSGANGQGRTKHEAAAGLRDAIRMILEERTETGMRGPSSDGKLELMIVE